MARASTVGLALALPLLAWSEPLPTLWSPYQKLTFYPLVQPVGPGGQPVVCGEVINVNNVGYQTMIDLLVYPAIYLLWRWHTEVRHAAAGVPEA